jgi:O-acetylserine/cysteine efflux transporter
LTATARLPARHALLALAVVAVWGTNFPIFKLALGTLPPLLLAVLRFALVLVPAVFFVRRPAVPWRSLAAYGLLIGAGQFGLLYLAVGGHIAPGLASLVIQTQVFFTIGLALFTGAARQGGQPGGEQLRAFQVVALLLATAGIAVIAWHTDAHSTPLGLAMVLAAAGCWAGGNQVARGMGRVDMLGVVVWSSAFALPPLLLLTLLVDGPARISQALAAADATVWAVVAWQAVGNSLFGYAVWAWLLSRHPAATVVPMALLVPVFGMASSALMLGEPLPAWKLIAAALVMAGLALNLLWPRLKASPLLAKV